MNSQTGGISIFSISFFIIDVAKADIPGKAPAGKQSGTVGSVAGLVKGVFNWRFGNWQKD